MHLWRRLAGGGLGIKPSHVAAAFGRKRPGEGRHESWHPVGNFEHRTLSFQRLFVDGRAAAQGPRLNYGAGGRAPSSFLAGARQSPAAASPDFLLAPDNSHHPRPFPPRCARDGRAPPSFPAGARQSPAAASPDFLIVLDHSHMSRAFPHRCARGRARSGIILVETNPASTPNIKSLSV